MQVICSLIFFSLPGCLIFSMMTHFHIAQPDSLGASDTVCWHQNFDRLLYVCKVLLHLTATKGTISLKGVFSDRLGLMCFFMQQCQCQLTALQPQKRGGEKSRWWGRKQRRHSSLESQLTVVVCPTVQPLSRCHALDAPIGTHFSFFCNQFWVFLEFFLFLDVTCLLFLGCLKTKSGFLPFPCVKKHF